jgi:hypothetical protein
MRRHHQLMSELGEERQLALEGSPLLMGTPIAPSMDSPLATSEDWRQLLDIEASARKSPNGQ